MKKTFLILGLAGLFLTSCKQEATGTVEVTEAEEVATTVENSISYTTIAEESNIAWQGAKILQDIEKGHNGKISVSEISFDVTDGKMTSGKVVADMTSLESLDLNDNPDLKGKLDGHLKAADFLDVKSFPNASFEITSIESMEEGDFNSKVSGNLKIKDNEKNITILANIEVTEEIASLKTEEFSIARSDFGVTYDGSAKNGFINPKFNLQVAATASK